MNRIAKVLMIALGLMLTALGLVACQGGGQTFRSKGYTLEASLDPDPPIVGENEVKLRLLDAGGESVEGAEVGVRAFMPAMGAMPAMEAKGKGEERGGGKYAAAFSLSMTGNWDFTITAQKHGAELARFDLQIAPTRPGLIDPNEGMQEAGESMAGGGHQHGGAPMGASSGAGVLSVPEPRRQLIGVRTGIVEKKELSRPIRTVGRVEVDETKLWHVTLKFSGWIEKLFVDFTGAYVKKGQPLFTLYSQELYVSQQEYLDALEAFKKGQATRSLLDAARERLTLWDLTEAQIEAIAKRGEASKYLTVYSPARGYVVEKMAVEGHDVKPGMRLYEIADLSSIWVIADVYEYEASLVKVGNEAWMSEPYAPGPPRKGVVDYVYPNVDVRSRTLPVRLVFSNPSLSLKPGMFVNVKIESPLGLRVAVPEEAVLFSGEHRYVFVDLGGGRLEPREIQVGEKSENYYAIASGLSGGERVVTSANFLVSSEAQLKGALPKWRGPDAATPENPTGEIDDSAEPMPSMPLMQEMNHEHPPAPPLEKKKPAKERSAPMPADSGMHDAHSPPPARPPAQEEESGEDHSAPAPDMGGEHERHMDMHEGHGQ